MKYIIKNCDNCYYYDDEENIKNQYWCEFERANTHFANPCYQSYCLLKQIVEKCKCIQFELDKGIINGNYPDKYKFFKSGRADAGKEILDLLEIEECEDE